MYVKKDLTELARLDKEMEYGKFRDTLNLLPFLNLEGGPWVAGGSIRRLLSHVEFDSCDIDVFFSCTSQFEEFQALLPEKFSKFKVIRENKFAKTFIGKPKSFLFTKPVEIQLICLEYCASAEKLIDGFDFTVCQFATDGRTLVTTEAALRDIKTNELVIHNLEDRDNCTTINHMDRYLNQGYHINNENRKKVLGCNGGKWANYYHSNKGKDLSEMKDDLFFW